MNRRQGGFTLIELLVAIAIVGILVSVAAVSYQDHIQRSARADAKAVLMELASWMERYYTTNGRYSTDAAGTTPPALPVTQAPKSGAARYNITVSAIGAQSYTLRARPTGAQTGADCGDLTLTHTGVQGVSSGNVADCWQR
jgi:type IV pilus assembly protein PilE